MKKITFILIALFSCFLVLAQTPQSFSYQAIVRDAQGNILQNQNVSFRFSILETSTTGNVVYIETQQTNSNNLGLVNLAIGNGTVQQGVFSDIQWGNASHFLKVELDITGGANFVDMGTTQLLSVPYALHAKTVEVYDACSQFSYYYADRDGDGYGDPFNVVFSCNPPAGYIVNNADCDDNMASVHPGAAEICNNIDDNCDGQIDEGLTLNTYYADADGDGYGNASSSVTICSTTIPTGYVNNSTDCDDSNANIHPGATELCNNIDDNCDGQVDEGLTMYTYYRDMDSDGFGNSAQSVTICSTTAPNGYVSNMLDCDDTNPNISPSAAEVCNGIDDDCDGLIDEQDAQGCSIFYKDNDGDGYGVTSDFRCLCSSSSPYTATYGGDCNDSNPDVHPGATELCNSIDDDCDGSIDEGLIMHTYYRDMDSDGYGNSTQSVTICSATVPNGYVSNMLDCDDTNPNISPSAAEVCNGIDDDCDGLIDEQDAQGCTIFYKDMDGDGYGVTSDFKCLCSSSFPYTATYGGDCNDSNLNVHPGATELCNGIDDDCDGTIDEGCVK